MTIFTLFYTVYYLWWVEGILGLSAILAISVGINYPVQNELNIIYNLSRTVLPIFAFSVSISDQCESISFPCEQC